MEGLSATQYLRQEIARLQQENEAHKIEIATLNRCLQALMELYWDIQDLGVQPSLVGLVVQHLHNTIEAIGAQDGSLLLLDPTTQELVFVLVHGRIAAQLVGHRIPADTGVAGWVLQNYEPVIVNNPRQDWRFSGAVDSEFAFLTRSIICVPLLQQARPIGVIELLNKAHAPFSETDAILALVLGQFITRAIELMQAQTDQPIWQSFERVSQPASPNDWLAEFTVGLNQTL